MPRMQGFIALLILTAVVGRDGLAMKYDRGTYQRRVKESQLREAIEPFQAGIFEVFMERPVPVTIQRKIKRVIEKALDSTGRHLGYRPTTPAQLMLFQGNTYDSIDDPNIASGGFYANKKIRMRFDYESDLSESLGHFERVFRHELTHLIVAAIDGGKTPRWLNEGLAVYESRNRDERLKGEGRAFYAYMQERGGPIPAEDFVKRNITWQYSRNPFFYDQSYIYAKYLVDRYGYGKLQSLFKSMKSGSTFSQAFKEIYGISYAALEKAAYTS